jgi:hypothetical protein
MLAQIIAPLFAGGGGILIGLFKIWLQSKSQEKINEQAFLHNERLARENQLIEFRELENENQDHPLFIFRGISSAGIVWLCALAYVYVFAIYAENASDIIWQLAPENASDHWSILFGLATWSEEHPEIIAVTKGGIAFWMGQPLISIVSASVTGTTFKSH